MPSINFDITGISSAYVEGEFDEAKQALEKEDYDVISLEENARLRIDQGAYSFISTMGNWVREGVIYVPKKGKYLTKSSPIMARIPSPNNHQASYPTPEQLEKAWTDSILIFSDLEKSIPTNRFGEDDLTGYIFGLCASNYGLFLKEKGIQEMVISTKNMEDRPFVEQIWFGGLDRNSGIYAHLPPLNNKRVRGIKYIPKRN